MAEIVFRLSDGATRTAVVEDGTSVMAAAVANGVPGVVGDCGGSMTCATCHVRVLQPEALTQSSEEELDMLEVFDEDPGPGSRLGCQVRVSDAMPHVVVEVPG